MVPKFEQFFYGEDFHAIADQRLQGCCIHLLCLEGYATFCFNGFPFMLRKGDTLIMSNPELLTELTSNPDLRVEYIVISLSIINRFLPPMHYGIGGAISLFSNPIISLNDMEAERLHEDIQHLRQRIDTESIPFAKEVRDSLAQAMIFDLFSFHASRSSVLPVAQSPGEIVRRFLNLLNGALPKTHREVAYYAGQLNVSARYLSDTIRRLTGKSASELIVRSTVPIITDLLKNHHLSIAQISDELNFNTVSYFIRYCKKHLGQTPAAYRASLLPAL